MMNRNAVYLIIVALAVGILVLSYELYQEQHKTGIEINVGKNSISVEKN